MENGAVRLPKILVLTLQHAERRQVTRRPVVAAAAVDSASVLLVQPPAPEIGWHMRCHTCAVYSLHGTRRVCRPCVALQPSSKYWKTVFQQQKIGRGEAGP